MAKWQFHRTGGAPIPVRRCTELAVVALDDVPVRSLWTALPRIAGRYGLATYSVSEFGAKLARALEQLAGPIDLSFSAVYRNVSCRTRTARVQGDLVIADGRRDPAFFGGQPRLLHDARLWEYKEIHAIPVQIQRLRELEMAGIDLVDLPSSPAVDNRFAGLSLAQPVVILLDRLHVAEKQGRVRVEWSR